MYSLHTHTHRGETAGNVNTHLHTQWQAYVLYCIYIYINQHTLIHAHCSRVVQQETPHTHLISESIQCPIWTGNYHNITKSSHTHTPTPSTSTPGVFTVCKVETYFCQIVCCLLHCHVCQPAAQSVKPEHSITVAAASPSASS